MPLDRIVNILGQSGNDVARIMAAAWLLDNPARAERLTPYAAALIGSRSAEIDFGDRPGSIVFASAPELLPQPTRVAFACERLLRSAVCRPTNHQILVAFDLDTLVTSVIATVDVPRPASDFSPLADPRGWETKAPLFFKHSQRCTLHEGDFATEPNSGPVGGHNYTGLLLEHVSIGLTPEFPIEAINVLTVNCGARDPSPSFSVTLEACLETRFGLSWSRAGLDVDRGRFVVNQSNGLAHLEGTKVARFTERAMLGFPIGRLMNLTAPFCLAALMSTLIFAGACHDAA